MNPIPSNCINIVHIRPNRTRSESSRIVPQTIAYATSLQSVRDIFVVRLEMGFAILNEKDVFRKTIGVKFATNNLQNQILPRYASVILGYADEISPEETNYVNKYGQIPILSNRDGASLKEGDWVTISRHFDITRFIREYAFHANYSRQSRYSKQFLNNVYSEQFSWTPV